MKHVLFVFIGGGFGSVLRYMFGKWFTVAGQNIPYGTFLANVLGSLLIGVILGYAARSSSLTESQSLLLATGFCGGFTTFSTFAFENQLYLKNGDYFNLGLYTIGSIVLGITAVFIGLYLSKLI